MCEQDLSTGYSGRKVLPRNRRQGRQVHIVYRYYGKRVTKTSLLVFSPSVAVENTYVFTRFWQCEQSGSLSGLDPNRVKSTRVFSSPADNQML